MKAAIFEQVNQPMKIQDIELADPQGREILVRTVAAGICHSDLLFYEGGWEHKLPTILYFQKIYFFLSHYFLCTNPARGCAIGITITSFIFTSTSFTFTSLP